MLDGCVFSLRFGLGNAPFFNEFVKTELFKQAVELGLIVFVPKRIPGLEAYGRYGADGRKLI